MSNDDDEIKVQHLKNVRAGLKSRVTYFKNKLSNNELVSVGELESGLNRLRLVYSKYEEVQAALEAVDDSLNMDRDIFEDSFGFVESRFIDRIRELNVKMKIESSTESVKLDSGKLSTSVSLKLPEIQLPKFNGSELGWLDFRGIFTELIQNNNKLSNIAKFHYLVSCVRDGKAYKFVQSLPMSNENYPVAWKTLTDHYNNEIIIQKTHMKYLYEVKRPIENSSTSLQSFIDIIKKHYNALKSLDISVQHWDLFLIHHLSDRLDEASRVEVVKKSPVDKLLSFNDFIEILQLRCRILEATRVPQNDRSNKPTRAMIAQHRNCIYCTGNHSLNACDKFKDYKVSPQDRYLFVKRHNLCSNCLNEGHRTLSCQEVACSVCSLKHHILLHFGRTRFQPSVASKSPSSAYEPNENPSNNALQQKCSVSSSHQSSLSITPPKLSQKDSDKRQILSSLKTERSKMQSQIMLATAVVWIRNSIGERVKCRALLDSGAQSNFVTKKTVQWLSLKTAMTKVDVYGINGAVSTLTKKVTLFVESRTSNFNISIECLVKQSIVGMLPSYPINIDSNLIPQSVELADPWFFEPDTIDLLLGAEVFAKVILNEKINILSKTPFIKTHLGYIVMGEIQNHPKFIESSVTTSSVTALCSFESLTEQMKKFWEIETIDYPQKWSLEEKLCESHYSNHVVRTKSGRYSVSLPIKTCISQLGDSSISALQQYSYMDKRLNSNPMLREKYDQFMSEYIELHHMEEVKNPDESNCIFEKTYYLPHHPVVRDSSSTTKLRVVFNASAKSSSNISLNDCMMVGPTIQQDICSIIMRFRKHQIAVTGDIAKMYRQILVHTDQQDLQRIWWNSSFGGPLRCYKLRTVTYGTASAPFLAIRTLFQLADDEKKSYPNESKILKRDFYVDDMLTGSDTEQNAIAVKNNIIELLARGGFELRKIQSNNRNVEQSSPSITEQSKSIVILGMNWDTELDQFSFSFKKYSIDNPCTKRSVLSEIAQLFDPLGLCAPIVFAAKSFMQKLWESEFGWDDELPSELCSFWNEFKGELCSVGPLRIPRCVIVASPRVIELHGFGDASDKGYGAVIYIRSVDNSNNCFVRILCAKTRVAPLRGRSTPELELCASVLLSQLATKVLASMDIQFSSVYFWTDSEITYYRIRSVPSRFEKFVANRISKIQDLTSPNRWYYIPTLKNPSDAASRGQMPTEFMANSIWWNGPDFLGNPILCIPNQPLQKDSKSFESEIRHSLEAHPAISARLKNKKDDEWKCLVKYSSYSTTLRVFGLVLRFIQLLKERRNLRKTGTSPSVLKLGSVNVPFQPLSAIELDNSLKIIVKHIQQEEYCNDIKNLRKNHIVSGQSNLRTLNPFIDEDGIMRVGGRLKHSDIPFDHKHQMLLPAGHSFTKLLVNHEHIRMLHAGAQSLLYSLRQRFWIVGGRSLCRKIVQNCIRCVRARPRTLEQIMGQLPGYRVNPARPFQNVGIDFCGPFLTKTNTRARTVIKTYVALFICLASKAIHMEVVSDLSTDAFLSTLRRFVCRRGLCSNIYSDNATNFVGAKSELQELRSLFLSEVHEHKVLKYCVDHGIQWHTIPPRSPHFGGLWEAAIKSAKHHMRRVLGQSSYTVEILNTLIVEIEACLNSRPIGYMSDDPNDFECLTPGHLLIGQPITSIPEPSLRHIREGRLSTYQKIQYKFQIFWRRWSLEYLSQLQKRTKWAIPRPNVRVGDLVILKEDNVPPLKWPLARILEVVKGDDGFVRVVTVRTSNSVFKRAITRICPIPIGNCSVSEENVEHLDSHQ